jgi:hypothetical protein
VFARVATPPPFRHHNLIREKKTKLLWGAPLALLTASLALASIGTETGSTLSLQKRFGFFRSLGSQESLSLDWSSLQWMGNLKGLDLAHVDIASAPTETAEANAEIQPVQHDRAAPKPKRLRKHSALRESRKETERRQIREIHQYLRKQVLSQVLWGTGSLSWVASLDSDLIPQPVTLEVTAKRVKRAKKREYPNREYSKLHFISGRSKAKVLATSAPVTAPVKENLKDAAPTELSAVQTVASAPPAPRVRDRIWISRAALGPFPSVYAAETPREAPAIFKRRVYSIPAPAPKSKGSKNVLIPNTSQALTAIERKPAKLQDKGSQARAQAPNRSPLTLLKRNGRHAARITKPREITLGIRSKPAPIKSADAVQREKPSSKVSLEDADAYSDAESGFFETGMNTHDTFLQDLRGIAKNANTSKSYIDTSDYPKGTSTLPMPNNVPETVQVSPEALSLSSPVNSSVQSNGVSFAYVSPSSLVAPVSLVPATPARQNTSAAPVRANRIGILAQAKVQARAAQQYVSVDRMKIEMGSSVAPEAEVKAKARAEKATPELGTVTITVSRAPEVQAPKVIAPGFVEAMNWKDPVSGGAKESISLEGVAVKKTDRGNEWIVARASDHLPTLSLARTPSLGKSTPLLSFNSRNALSILGQTQVNASLGVIFGRLPAGMTLSVDGRTEAPLYFPEGTENQSFILFNVEPGARIVSVSGVYGEKVSALAAPVLSKTATFLDLSVFENRQVRGWVLSGDNAKAQGLPGVLVRAVGHPQSAQKTDRWGRFLLENLRTAPGHPIYLESEASHGDTHRYAVPESMWGGVSLFRFSAARVDALAKQLEGGLHSTSGLLIAAFPFPEALSEEGGAVFPRLVPVEASSSLIPETYTLNARDELLVNTPLRGENRRAIAVQVPEGLNRLEIEDAAQKVVWSSFLISSPGVINVVLPE